MSQPAPTIRNLFATPLYRAPLASPAVLAWLLADLDHSCRVLAQEDSAGRKWSREHGYRGYTSYASLDDLPKRDPAFAEAKRYLDRAARAFAKAAHFEEGYRPKLDSLWANVMKQGAAHSGHIHPQAVISGTLYVALPPQAGALRFEDPRLPMLMKSPLRAADAPAEVQSFYTIAPQVGEVYLWESWLRHEVLVNNAKDERISISFNYR